MEQGYGCDEVRDRTLTIRQQEEARRSKFAKQLPAAERRLAELNEKLQAANKKNDFSAYQKLGREAEKLRELIRFLDPNAPVLTTAATTPAKRGGRKAAGLVTPSPKKRRKTAEVFEDAKETLDEEDSGIVFTDGKIPQFDPPADSDLAGLNVGNRGQPIFSMAYCQPDNEFSQTIAANIHLYYLTPADIAKKRRGKKADLCPGQVAARCGFCHGDDLQGYFVPKDLNNLYLRTSEIINVHWNTKDKNGQAAPPKCSKLPAGFREGFQAYDQRFQDFAKRAKAKGLVEGKNPLGRDAVMYKGQTN